MHEEAERLDRLVQNLLEMTRLESGGVRCAEGVARRSRRSWARCCIASARGCAAATSTTRMPADLPLVEIDEILIEQVLINLLDNALKYSPAGSPVEISAAAGDERVVVEVADRGPGLAPGDEQRVFEKFYRSPTACRARGSGLGLSICRGLVEAHGGRIEAAEPARRRRRLPVHAARQGDAPAVEPGDD